MAAARNSSEWSPPARILASSAQEPWRRSWVRKARNGGLVAAIVLTAVAKGTFGWAAAPESRPAIEAYGRLPAIELMRLSPKGDRYAEVGMDGAERVLAVRDIGGALIHEVKIHALKVRGLDWADNDHLTLDASITMLHRNVKLEVGEDLYVFTLNVAQHRLKVIFANQADLYDEVFGEYGFSTDGAHAYGYFGGISLADVRYKAAGFRNLYRVDLDTGDHYFIAGGGTSAPTWFVDPTTGKVAATLLSDRGSGAWRVSVDDKIVARGQAPFGRPSLVGYGRDGRTLLVDRPSDGDDTISEVNLDGSGTTEIPSDDLLYLITDRATARWIGRMDDGDFQVLHLFDPAMQARWDKAVALCGAGHATLVSQDDGFVRVIIHTEGAGDAGTYCLADTAQGSRRDLGKDYPTIGPEQVGEVRMVDWKAADGLALRGVLTLPPGRPAARLPLIVLPHGGPQARDYPGFDWWAQAFASRGYAVFQPNFRGSSGYGEAFTRAGFGEWGRKMQTDISDGVAALAERGIVDPRRACIVGASYGGYAALAGVTVQQGLYRCAISYGGVADPGSMIEYDTPWGGPAKTDANRYWRRFLGVEGSKKINLDDISPLHLAARADAPILLMVGADDTVVSPSQSQAMAKALQKAGRPFEGLVFYGEDHWLSRGASRTAMLTKAIDFAEKYDPPN